MGGFLGLEVELDCCCCCGSAGAMLWRRRSMEEVMEPVGV
jgi:hypothetical protein